MSEKAEIEVTPAMLRAGRAVLAGYDPRFSEIRGPETVKRIYETMERARLKSARKVGSIRPIKSRP